MDACHLLPAAGLRPDRLPLALFAPASESAVLPDALPGSAGPCRLRCHQSPANVWTRKRHNAGSGGAVVLCRLRLMVSGRLSGRACRCRLSAFLTLATALATSPGTEMSLGSLAATYSSAAVLGTATTSMLMGHSYLIAPAMSLTPLLNLLARPFRGAGPADGCLRGRSMGVDAKSLAC